MAWSASIIGTRTVAVNTADPTVSITPVTGDDLLVLVVYIDDTTEADLSGVPTDGSDTYVQAHVFTNGNQKAYIFYVDGPTVETKTITINTGAVSTDIIATAMTFTGTLHATPVGDTADGTSSALATCTTGTGGNTMSPNRDNSVIISIFGQTGNNSAEAGSTFGTNQNLMDDGSQGGGEKFYACGTYEILTATGTNEQSITMTKSGTNLVAAVEIQHADEAAVARRRIFLIT